MQPFLKTDKYRVHFRFTKTPKIPKPHIKHITVCSVSTQVAAINVNVSVNHFTIQL